MRLSIARFGAPAILLSAGLSSFVACGGSTASTAPPSVDSGAPDATPIPGITISKSASNVVSGGHATLTVRDDDGQPTAVTWSVPAGQGTVDEANVYTAPIIFKGQDVTIVAARADHPEVTASASLHVYSAFPELLSSGGPVLAKPVFTSISFADDVDPTVAETVVSQLPPSAYWTTTTAEYGVGPGSSTARVHLTEKAPVTTTDDAIGSWLASKLDGSHPEIPAPVEGSVYVVTYPATSVITYKGDKSCTMFSGYHSETIALGKPVPYVVATRCPNTVQHDFEYAMVEEMIDAAMDPFRLTNPAYSAVDPAHLIWTTLRGGEASGICQMRTNGENPTTTLPFETAKIWSNQAAAAGKEPCVPETTEVVAGIPILEEDIPMTFAPSFHTPAGINATTKGIHIPVGKTKTVDVVVHAQNSPTTAYEFEFASYVDTARNPYFKGELTPTTGKDGDHLKLKITTLKVDATYGGEPFLIVPVPPSTAPDSGARYTFGFVGTAP